MPKRPPQPTFLITWPVFPPDSDDDNAEEVWELWGFFTPGTPGSYWDPPEGSEIEIVEARKDGEVRQFDAWCSAFKIEDKYVEETIWPAIDEENSRKEDDSEPPDYDDYWNE